MYRDGKELKLLRPQDVGTGDQTICDVTTPSCRPDRLKAVAVHVFVENDPNPIKIDVQGTATDAIFLTESAVEKFLYPYYRSHRIWDDGMDSLQEKFEQTQQAVGILHKAPSNSDTFSPEGTLEVAGRAPDGTGQVHGPARVHGLRGDPQVAQEGVAPGSRAPWGEPVHVGS